MPRMGESSLTCWTVIRDAAAGRADDRGRRSPSRYEDAIRAYLGARWRHSPLIREIDDAAQDVFLECFRADGALTRVDEERGGFRGFLYGVTRNVARRTEQARHPTHDPRTAGRPEGRRRPGRGRLPALRPAWAGPASPRRVRPAGPARGREGNGALERVEILRLRFERGLARSGRSRRTWARIRPARTTSTRKARREFRQALIDVVREHEALGVAAAEAECCG